MFFDLHFLVLLIPKVRLEQVKEDRRRHFVLQEQVRVVLLGLILLPELVRKALQLLYVLDEHLYGAVQAELRVREVLLDVFSQVCIICVQLIFFELYYFRLQEYHLAHEGLCLVFLVVPLENSLSRLHNKLADLGQVSEIFGLIDALALLLYEEIKEVSLARRSFKQFVRFEEMKCLLIGSDNRLVAEFHLYLLIIIACPQQVRLCQVLALGVLSLQQILKLRVHLILHGNVEVAFDPWHLLD